MYENFKAKAKTTLNRPIISILRTMRHFVKDYIKSVDSLSVILGAYNGAEKLKQVYKSFCILDTINRAITGGVFSAELLYLRNMLVASTLYRIDRQVGHIRTEHAVDFERLTPRYATLQQSWESFCLAYDSQGKLPEKEVQRVFFDRVMASSDRRVQKELLTFITTYYPDSTRLFYSQGYMQRFAGRTFDMLIGSLETCAGYFGRKVLHLGQDADVVLADKQQIATSLAEYLHSSSHLKRRYSQWQQTHSDKSGNGFYEFYVDELEAYRETGRLIEQTGTNGHAFSIFDNAINASFDERLNTKSDLKRRRTYIQMDKELQLAYYLALRGVVLQYLDQQKIKGVRLGSITMENVETFFDYRVGGGLFTFGWSATP